MSKLAIGSALVCLLSTPVLAGDVNWADVTKDLKDLKVDFKDLKADYTDLKSDKLKFDNAVKAGNLNAAIKDAADIAADKRDIRADRHDIRADIKDLKHDGVNLPSKGKH